MIRQLVAAVQFLTVIPLGRKSCDPSALAGSSGYFPVVGLLLGFLLVGLARVCAWIGCPPFAAHTVTIVALIILTGGLHLDGLSDTCDGFASSREKERILEVMRDSHAGVMGVLGVVCVILLKIAFLGSLAASDTAPALLLMCVLSRWSLAGSIYLFPYARPEGKVRVFRAGITRKSVLIATAVALLAAAVFAGARGIALALAVAAGALLFNAYVRRRIGGITGDTLGACNELMEIVVLAAACILKGGAA